MARSTFKFPSLIQSLQGRDLGHLRIIAELWDLPFDAPDARVGLARLVDKMLEKDRFLTVVSGLAEKTRDALHDLVLKEGRESWPVFSRQHGGLREMGPARRDREKPYSNSSPVEALWYRGIIGRTFFETDEGVQEFVFIPEEFLEQIPLVEMDHRAPLGRLATQLERQEIYLANDLILDRACTLLAGLRIGMELDDLENYWGVGLETADGNPAGISPEILRQLLASAGLLARKGIPNPDTTRIFLEAERGDALLGLVRAWMNSVTFNELRQLPGLKPEGEWVNDPREARRAIFDFLATVPGWQSDESESYRPWWSITAFVNAVKTNDPDYQRPSGDYDSWHIRSEETNEFLRGFESWDAIDGALIRYILYGPCYWLGLLDLAGPGQGALPAAFRFSAIAAQLLRGEAPDLAKENEPLHISSGALIRVPRLAPRAVRYQIARFSHWENNKAGAYQYRITPASLERAKQAGLQLKQLLALSRRYAPALPPQFVSALERWEEKGTEARFEEHVVLRMANPELMQQLRNSRAGRFLGDPLGPTTVIVSAGALTKVQAVLAEMGILAEVR